MARSLCFLASATSSLTSFLVQYMWSLPDSSNANVILSISGWPSHACPQVTETHTSARGRAMRGCHTILLPSAGLLACIILHHLLLLLVSCLLGFLDQYEVLGGPVSLIIPSCLLPVFLALFPSDCSRFCIHFLCHLAPNPSLYSSLT